MNIYQKTSKEILKELEVEQSVGLTSLQAQQRLENYGSNSLDVASNISIFKIIARQFKDILIGVLIIAATVSLALELLDDHGSLIEPLLIYAIVLMIVAIGFFNEYKAEKTVEALKKLVGQYVTVRRDGRLEKIDVLGLTVGDIVVIEEGQKIAADMRILQSNMLQVNEASLTGESNPVEKHTKAIKDEVAIGDQGNMLFSGTLVTVGSGEAVVTAVGLKTQLGAIADLVNQTEERHTPMQNKLDDLGKKIGLLVLVACVVVFAIIYASNPTEENLDGLRRLMFAFTAAVALAVAAIPEGLAFVVRISLALGARRMAADNALVRKLSAVEALGSTDVICSDKTGTLTKGEMTVHQIWCDNQVYDVKEDHIVEQGSSKAAENNALSMILSVGSLCNNADIKSDPAIGDPTEIALLYCAEKYNLQNNMISNRRLQEIPFSSNRKMMSTIHEFDDHQFIMLTKGAPEVLIEHCTEIEINGKVKTLNAGQIKEIKKMNQQFAQSGHRVLAFAYKKASKKQDLSKEQDLVFVGLQAIIDPPREEVKEVMHSLHAEAGMRVVMITGDHISTARAVASEIGIDGEAIEGRELDKMSDDEILELVETTAVFARVNPEHKIRIVQALQANGHQVAMTGDGVNDAPAIKAADIGVAMGVNGSDATKEVADLILLDDQFLTIIHAVKEGRGIFDNIRKFVNYLLSANLAEVISVLGGVVLFRKLILSASQILFINIITDGIPAVALGSDESEKNIMRFKPKHYQGEIISKRIWFDMLAFGSMMSLVILSHFWYIDKVADDTKRAVSVVFVSMVAYELVRLITIRKEYNIAWFSNPWLSVAMVFSLVLQVVVLYLPFTAKIFDVKPIALVDWAVIASASLALYVFMKLVDGVFDSYIQEA